jgi:hypothetical protein
MLNSKSPRHMVLVRWGNFRLELVGRAQILIALAAVGALFGLRLLSARGYF